MFERASDEFFCVGGGSVAVCFLAGEFGDVWLDLLRQAFVMELGGQTIRAAWVTKEAWTCAEEPPTEKMDELMPRPLNR